MPTNFENIAINDRTGTERKVAGDFEAQGADTIFHQTARNLNTILEEVTGVTLSSATPTDIALNGMESHVILDIRGYQPHELFVQVQYTTGGPFYAADWEKLQPIRSYPGIRDVGADYNLQNGELFSGTNTAGGDQSGSVVYMIPTNGAVTVRLVLYGSSVTIAGCAWKRVVLASPPVTKAVTRNVRSMERQSFGFSTTQQPYVDGEWLGPHDDITVPLDARGDAPSLVTVRDLVVRNGFMLPDFDFVIASTSLNVTDGAVWTGSDAWNVYALFEFRHIPGPGQYKISPAGSGGSVAQVLNLNFVIPRRYDGSDQTVAKAALVARGPFASNAFIAFHILFDFG